MRLKQGADREVDVDIEIAGIRGLGLLRVWSGSSRKALATSGHLLLDSSIHSDQ